MKVPNLEATEEEVVHRDLVELVWDPEEGIVTTSPYTEPRPDEYEMRVVDGVQTPFLSEAALQERFANYYGFFRKPRPEDFVGTQWSVRITDMDPDFETEVKRKDNYLRRILRDFGL